MEKEIELLNEVERKLKRLLKQYHSNQFTDLLECAASVAFVRDQLRHLTPVTVDEFCGCVPAGDNSVSPGFIPALKCTACGKIRH